MALLHRPSPQRGPSSRGPTPANPFLLLPASTATFRVPYPHPPAGFPGSTRSVALLYVDACYDLPSRVCSYLDTFLFIFYMKFSVSLSYAKRVSFHKLSYPRKPARDGMPGIKFAQSVSTRMHLKLRRGRAECRRIFWLSYERHPPSRWRRPNERNATGALTALDPRWNAYPDSEQDSNARVMDFYESTAPGKRFRSREEEIPSRCPL